MIFTILLILIFFFSVWLEWRKKSQKRRFMIRSVLLLMALGSLGVILLKPQKNVDGLLETQEKAQIFEKTQEIKFIFWKKQILLGDTLIVFGKYEKTDNNSIRVFVEQNGEKIDSVQFDKIGLFPFRLKISTKEKGCFVANLSIQNQENSVLSTEKIPFEVQNITRTKILFWQSAPDSELRFVKDWLARKNNKIVIITQTSKEKRRIERLNTEESTNFLSLEFLEKQDLLVLDWEAANTFSADEQKNVKNAIRKGLGVLLMPDDRDLTQAKIPDFLRFEFEKEADLAYRTVKPVAMGENQTFAQMTDIEAFPYSIKANFLEKTLLTDGFEQALVSQKRYGKGKIGITLLKNSQQWVQEGNSPYFEQYWSLLLENLYREKLENQILIRNFIPKIGEKQEIEFWADSATTVEIDGEKVYLSQNPFESYRWEGVFWAKKEGWHKIRAKEKEQNWYVFGQKEWETLQERKPQKTKDKKIRQERINLWYFFALFVLSFGLLWGEDRKLWRF